MKFGKATYDSQKKMYISEITEGIRFCIECHSGQYNPTFESIHQHENIQKIIVPAILDQTKGWFTKALQKEWLIPRLSITIPTNDIPETFDGTVTIETKVLMITKDKFTVVYQIIDKKASEKIELDIAEKEILEETTISSNSGEQEPLQVGPTRRMLHKQFVMVLRNKAAKILYRAEQETQHYCEIYGEDTDWEDDESDESDESDLDE
jgi:hypothetical protein